MHEMSNPVSWKKKYENNFKMPSAESMTQNAER